MFTEEFQNNLRFLNMSRDVLAPQLMRMGPNRCYRVNLIHEDFSSQYETTTGAQKQELTARKTYAEEGKKAPHQLSAHRDVCLKWKG